MTKIYKYLLPVCFLIFIFTGLILNIGNIKTAIGIVKEDIKSLDIKDAISDFETSLNNNFYGKMNIVDINGGFKKILNQKIVNGAVLGNNEKLYAQDVTEEVIDWNKENLNLQYTKQLLSYAREKGAETLYVQHPDKFDYTKDSLPYGIKISRTDRDEYYVRNLEAEGEQVLDLREDKYKAKEFYKTDHHWTVESAFNASSIIAKHFGKNIDMENFSIKTERKSMLGSNGIRTGQYYVGKDDYSIIIPSSNIDYYYETYDTKHNLQSNKKGDFKDTLINMEYFLNPEYLNKYNTYIVDGSVEARIINKNKTGEKKVLFIGDSFARPIVTFLSTEFSEVRFLDAQKGRYNDSFKAYIDEYKPDIVMIMYNYGFSDETLLKDLKNVI